MGMRVYRAALMVAQEARALHANVHKQQLAITKESLALAHQTDSRVQARHAEQLQVQLQMAEDERNAAVIKTAASVAGLMYTAAQTTATTLNLAGKRAAERADGRLDLWEERLLRQQAGLPVSPLHQDRPSDPDQTAAVPRATERPRSPREEAGDVTAEAREQAERLQEAMQTGATADVPESYRQAREARLTELGLARREVNASGAALRAAGQTKQGWFTQQIAYLRHIGAERRLEKAERDWDDWQRTHVPQELALGVSLPAQWVLDAADEWQGGGPAASAASGDGPGSEARSVPIRPGPLPPPVAGRPPDAGRHQAAIIQAPRDLVRAAMPPHLPTSDVSPSEPAPVPPPQVEAASPSPTSRSPATAAEARQTPPATAGREWLNDTHLHRWQDDTLRMPLKGDRSQRLQQLAALAQGGVLTPGDLRSNADLFSEQERTEIEGLLRADIGAAYMGYRLKSFAGQRLSRQAGEAAGAPRLADGPESSASAPARRIFAQRMAALDLLASSDDVARTRSPEAIARQQKARERFEDLAYGQAGSRPIDRLNRLTRWLTGEVEVTLGMANFAKVVNAARAALLKDLEGTVKHSTEAAARSEQIAQIKAALAAVDQERQAAGFIRRA